MRASGTGRRCTCISSCSTSFSNRKPSPSPSKCAQICSSIRTLDLGLSVGISYCMPTNAAHPYPPTLSLSQLSKIIQAGSLAKTHPQHASLSRDGECLDQNLRDDVSQDNTRTRWGMERVWSAEVSGAPNSDNHNFLDVSTGGNRFRLSSTSRGHGEFQTTLVCWIDDSVPIKAT